MLWSFIKFKKYINNLPRVETLTHTPLVSTKNDCPNSTYKVDGPHVDVEIFGTQKNVKTYCKYIALWKMVFK